jgi:hypothetical protein
LTLMCMHSIIQLYIQPEAEMPESAKRAISSRTTMKVGKELASEVPRKKNYRLHQSKIDRAMEILGTRTETETIEQALEMIAFQREMLDAVDAMYGAGVVNVFDD